MATMANWDFGASGLKLGDPDMPTPHLAEPEGDAGLRDADTLTLDTGTLRVGFRQLLQMGPDEDRILTFDAGGTALTLGVTEDGVVRLTHVTADDSASFETPEEFFFPGDSVLVTHSWDFGGTGGRLSIDNLSTGAVFEAEVPGTLTLDESALEPSAWQLGAADDPILWGFNGRLMHLSLHDEGAEDEDADADETLAAPPLWDDAVTAEDRTMIFTYEGGNAASQDSFGIYVVDPETGLIGDVQLVWADLRADLAGGDLVPGETVFALDVPEGAQVGAFLIDDGAALNDFAALGPGALAFRTDADAPAGLDDAAPLLVHVAPDGSKTPVAGAVWHSAGYGAQAGLNPDGAAPLTGIGANDDGSWTFGWGATADDDTAPALVFSVDPGQAGARFLNPDAVATAPDEAEVLAEDDGAGIVMGGIAEDDAPEVLVLRAFDRLSEPAATGSETPDDLVVLDASGQPAQEMSMQLAFVIPCFTPGTLIDTSGGPVPVEHLKPGDRVLTRDHGFRSLRWVGRKDMDADDLSARPEFRAVLIAADALGPGLPARPMRVSPQHRILMAGPEAEMMFGSHEVLIPALHMVGLPGITRDTAPTVTYIHVMCDRHEVIRGDGIWSESFQPGDLSLAGLDADQRAELFHLFPELEAADGRQSYVAARMTLKSHEARALLTSGQPGTVPESLPEPGPVSGPVSGPESGTEPRPAAASRFGANPDSLAAERWDRVG